MNERFEELKRRAVAEADTSHIDFDNMSHSEIQMLGDIAVEEKFAELIVRECLNIAANADMTELEGPDPEDVLYVACKQIKKHFGVEE
jgi:hypothetical protein